MMKKLGQLDARNSCAAAVLIPPLRRVDHFVQRAFEQGERILGELGLVLLPLTIALAPTCDFVVPGLRYWAGRLPRQIQRPRT